MTLLKKLILVGSISLGLIATANASEGMISVKSNKSVQKTSHALVQLLNKKGMTHFTTIDHAAGAARTGQELRDTKVVVFGNPKVGTPLMQCSQSLAIDLPQKMLVWEDAEGGVWLSYNDPNYLAQRHGMENNPKCAPIIKKVSNVLATFAAKAGE